MSRWATPDRRPRSAPAPGWRYAVVTADQVGAPHTTLADAEADAAAHYGRPESRVWYAVVGWDAGAPTAAAEHDAVVARARAHLVRAAELVSAGATPRAAGALVAAATAREQGWGGGPAPS